MSANLQSIRQALKAYQEPDLWRSLWQLANTLVPYIALWVLMIFSLKVSYFLTLPLAILAAGFMIRTFIIFHDCGHSSFFKSQKANDTVGIITGLLTFTPYYRWRRDHAIHHATAGDLDRRGTGDVMVLTVKEYQALPRWRRWIYALWRHPLVMFTIGSFLVFTLFHRFSSPSSGRRERFGVYYTNLALAGMFTGLVFLIGWKALLVTLLPILIVGPAVGVWMFYIQHNFPGTYWERHDHWNFFTAGLEGSSFYKLPRILQWFTGNIGFHHIHHLGSHIPNYLLETCYRENPVFQVTPLTLRSSLNCLKLRLWDEERRMMIGFDALEKHLTPETA